MAPKKRFLLRLEPELHRRLEAWAADEFRSVNGQIEFLLRDALLRSGRHREEPTPKRTAETSREK